MCGMPLVPALMLDAADNEAAAAAEATSSEATAAAEATAGQEAALELASGSSEAGSTGEDSADTAGAGSSGADAADTAGLTQRGQASQPQTHSGCCGTGGAMAASPRGRGPGCMCALRAPHRGQRMRCAEAVERL